MKRYILTESELIKAQKGILADYIKRSKSKHFSICSFCTDHHITYAQFKILMCNMGLGIKPLIKQLEIESKKPEHQDFLYYGVSDLFAENSNKAIEVTLGLEHEECEFENSYQERLHEHMEYSKFMTIVGILNLKSTEKDLDKLTEINAILKRDEKIESNR